MVFPLLLFSLLSRGQGGNGNRSEVFADSGTSSLSGIAHSMPGAGQERLDIAVIAGFVRSRGDTNLSNGQD